MKNLVKLEIAKYTPTIININPIEMKLKFCY